MKLTAATESFPFAEVFTISRGSRTEAHVVTVTIEADGAAGRGECVPYARYGETLESVVAEIGSLPPQFTFHLGVSVKDRAGDRSGQNRVR